MCIVIFFFFFFFSSRRRHTRCSRDWSSDVCSSDLVAAGEARREEGEETEPGISSLRCRQAQGSRPAGRFACVSRLCMMYRAQHADYITFLMPAWVQHPRVESS